MFAAATGPLAAAESRLITVKGQLLWKKFWSTAGFRRAGLAMHTVVLLMFGQVCNFPFFYNIIDLWRLRKEKRETQLTAVVGDAFHQDRGCNRESGVDFHSFCDPRSSCEVET
jgi:hypothetical protein